MGAAVREKSPKKADRSSLRPPKEEVMEIVRAYSTGEMTIPQLKVKYGLRSRRTVYNWMLAAVGDKKYHELVTQMLVNRVAEGDEKLEDAKDVLEVQRAREIARFARMDFERRRPALYGQKQLNVNVHELTVNAGLVGDLGEMLSKVSRKALPAPKDVDDAEEVDR